MDTGCTNFVDVVISGRREAMHLAPVIHALRKEYSTLVRVITIATRDHDLNIVLNSLDIVPDVQWRIRGTDNESGIYFGEILLLLGELWNSQRPNWLLSFGHSSFTFSCAFSAFQNSVAIAHLCDANTLLSRCRNSDHDSQIRKSINAIADLHFTACGRVKNTLINEGIDENRIYAVGSPIADSGRLISQSLLFNKDTDELFPSAIQPCWHLIKKSKIVLFELNNLRSQQEMSEEFLRSIESALGDHKIVFLDPSEGANLRLSSRVIRLARVNHLQRCLLLSRASCAVSDSIETLDESSAFGTRGILLQSNTDRFDLVSAGWVTLASNFLEGVSKQIASIARESATKNRTTKPFEALGSTSTGASARIAQALTIQRDESVQKLRTSLPLQRAQ